MRVFSIVAMAGFSALVVLGGVAAARDLSMGGGPTAMSPSRQAPTVHGRRGPRGPRGRRGPRGDPGADVTLTTRNVVDATGPDATLGNAGAAASSVASCPSGSVAIGGGWDTHTKLGESFVVVNRRLGTTGWEVRIVNGAAEAASFYATATCALLGPAHRTSAWRTGRRGPRGRRGPPGPQGSPGRFVVDVPSATGELVQPGTGDTRSSIAKCPEGRVAVSGGWEGGGIFVARDSVVRNRRVGPTSWEVRMISHFSHDNASFEAYVLCGGPQGLARFAAGRAAPSRRGPRGPRGRRGPKGPRGAAGVLKSESFLVVNGPVVHVQPEVVGGPPSDGESTVGCASGLPVSIGWEGDTMPGPTVEENRRTFDLLGHVRIRNFGSRPLGFHAVLVCARP